MSLTKTIQPTIGAFRNNKTLVQNLVNTLPYSASFLKYNNRWRAPQLSTRKVKELERAAIFHNIPFPTLNLYKKESNSNKHGFIKAFKGRKSVESKHDARLDKIADALKTMRPKMEKIRLEEKERRYQDMYDLGQFGKGGMRASKGRGALYLQNAGKKKKDSVGKKKKKK